MAMVRYAQSKQASRGNSVFLSYPEFNTGYNARDRCINGTVGYGRFCAINNPEKREILNERKTQK